MNLLYFMLFGTLLSLLLNQPILGLVVAFVTLMWLVALRWTHRKAPYDPKDF